MSALPSPVAPASVSPADGPAGWWAALAGELAGAPEVLIGRWRPGADGGRVEYDTVRPLTPALPVEPSAVRVYSDAGLCRALWLDFDPRLATGGAAAVLRDATAAAELLAGHGALVLVDETARGGRHVIAPLAAPTSKQDLEPVVRALAALYPTLDTGPMLNVARGCMAVPGATTRRGEVRQLVTPLDEARRAVTRRSAPGLVPALRAALAPAAAVVPDERIPAVHPRAAAVPGGPRSLPVLARGIAERGIYPTGRYPSPSEARQGVLVAAACRGWSLVDVDKRMTGGEWPGLARLYAKYGQGWHKALERDWDKALIYAANRPPLGAVSQDHTRGKTTSRGAAQTPSGPRAASAEEYRFLRRAHLVLRKVAHVWCREEAGRTRLVALLAVLAHAHRTGSRIISPGTRSLTLIAGLIGHSAIAKVLRTDRDDLDGWVRLIERGTGVTADRYEIVIPDRYATVGAGEPLPTGRLSGVHPIFAPGLLAPGVGLSAWHVIDAVERGARTRKEIAAATGLSSAQLRRALDACVQVKLLATTDGDAYRRTRRSLDRAGRDVGLADRIAARREHYDVERRLWRVWLADRGRADLRAAGYQLVSGGTAVPDDDVPLWLPGWQDHPPEHDTDPPSVHETAVALLAAAFGAELLDVVLATA